MSITGLVLLALSLLVCTESFVLQPSITTPYGSTPSTKYDITRNAVEGSVDFGTLDGSDLRIGIIKTRWNKEAVDSLLDGAKEALKECGVKDENVFVKEIPGSYELPLAARFLALSGTVDAVICMGVLIKGDTMHFEYICSAVSSGIMNVQLQTSTPCIFGVLTALNDQQVVDRSTGDNNHGYGWGKTAIEMALLRNEALGKTGKKNRGFGLEAGNDYDDSDADAKDPEKLRDPLRSIGF
uniref:6,7-dimethyl-8-ribityllumazine synthase n=1 Tax=Corethron hystrix TaxID=216773 RepID=A0A7S1BJ35_9STRA|mmetsp:Transcript_30170/g.69165  ORF Transcript_30170/g.69165 Transcript_30170/m.69165 type:complete len:240 (+) Transcript_30170:111-830(+)